MRLLGAFLLLATISVSAHAAEPVPASKPSEEIPWYRRVFLGERSKPTPPPPTTAAKPPVPISRESMERMFNQEKEVYIQRLAAISKIRQMALDRDDEAMLKKADELEKNAQQLFEDRTARLKNSAMESDRAALERRPTDERPATAERPSQRRRPTTGGNN